MHREAVALMSSQMKPRRMGLTLEIMSWLAVYISERVLLSDQQTVQAIEVSIRCQQQWHVCPSGSSADQLPCLAMYLCLIPVQNLAAMAICAIKQ